MINHNLISKIEIIFLIIPKITLMKHLNYKLTWWLYSDSSFIQGELKQRYGDLIHFWRPHGLVKYTHPSSFQILIVE